MVLNVTVKTLDSQNYHFTAEDDWTIQQFKDHIQDTINVTPNEQRLIFCGRVLQDDKKLAEYDCNGKVIHLVRRPPPSLDNPSQGNTSGTDSDTNNILNENINNFVDGFVDGVRSLENNVLFSAMNLGPEPNMQHILRHIFTLQQAIVTETTNDGTAIRTTIEPVSMTDINRHLYNAYRLLRITFNTINECLTRIGIPPATSARLPSVNANNNPRQVVASASSHTDLHLNSLDLLAGEIRTATRSSTQISTDDNFTDVSSRTNRVDLPRQSLTTDDLPAQTERTASQIPSMIPSMSSRVRGQESESSAGTRQRMESQLQQYLSIVNYSCDLQESFQNIVVRYRQLIDISSRGGLIVPQTSAANNNPSDANNPQTDQDDLPEARTTEPGTEPDSDQTPAQSPRQQRPISFSSSLMEEARILSQYIPRILHHMGHLQHALSDFSVDFNRGRLLLCAPSHSNYRTRQTAIRSNPPINNISSSRNGGGSTDQGSTNSATAATSQARHSAPTDPAAQPIARNRVSVAFDVTAMPATMTASSIPVPDNRTPNSSSTQNQQQNHSESPQQQQTTNSTQTTHRPISVISGRMPLPFDYYLPCLSPWASVGTSNRPGVVDAISATIQFRTARPETQSAGVENESARTTTNLNTAPSAPPTVLDMGLTEVVSNIVSSIFRPRDQPQQQQQQQQSQQNQAPSQNQAHDPIFNMIPELALNAVSQIFGRVSDASIGSQTNSTINERQQPTATNLSSNTVMMDIDIDDSSSSQSEPRYQDAWDSNSPHGHSSSSHRSSMPQAGHSRDQESELSNSNLRGFDRNQLIEAMHNHPDWLPIIEADISTMEQQQQSSSNNSQQFFSDAYLSCIPRKRRRLLTATPDRVLVLQPQPSTAITNILRRAITNSTTSNIDSLDQIIDTISNDLDLQRAYEDYIKSAIELRLKSDDDFSPQRFENSSKYFR